MTRAQIYSSVSRLSPRRRKFWPGILSFGVGVSLGLALGGMF